LCPLDKATTTVTTTTILL